MIVRQVIEWEIPDRQVPRRNDPTMEAYAQNVVMREFRDYSEQRGVRMHQTDITILDKGDSR